MEQLDILQHKRSELNNINITDEEAIKLLKEYDDLWFRNISPYTFRKPLKLNLIELNIKRFKLVCRLNKVIEVHNNSSQIHISKIYNIPLCNTCYSKLIYIAKGKVYCESCNKNDDILFNKKGIYNPRKHFRNWIDHIIGREDDIQATDLNRIKDNIIDILNTTKVNINDITIHDIRNYLKLCKATKYNKNLTKLYREVTGKETPMLCQQTETKLLHYFNIIILISNNVTSNLKSYPYYIYKLIELFGTNEDKKVLKFIYLQSTKTLSESDKCWREVCNKIGINFIPTI